MPAPKRFTNTDHGREPLTFEIAYRKQVTPEATEANPEPQPEWVEEVESFTTVVMPSAGALLDFGRWIGATAVPVEALNDWFDACLPDVEHMRFLGLIHDKDVALDIEVLGQVAAWLSEEFGERPTLPSAPSPSGSQPAGTGPTEPADSAVSA